jgi:F-type H+-transporting ATPase subunit delta
MPRVSVIAKNYAKALFLAGRKNNMLDKILEELTTFKQNFSTSFSHELKNPVISKNDLDKIIKEVSIKFNLGILVANFFSSIVRNRRLNLFPEIYEEFCRLHRQYQNIIEVELIFASQPQKNQVDQVKLVIGKKYPDKTIAVRVSIKEKILGGMQIKIGSEMIDTSLKNQLDSLKKECLAIIN